MTFCEATQLLYKNEKVCRHSWPSFKYVWISNEDILTINEEGEEILFSPKAFDLRASDWKPYAL